VTSIISPRHHRPAIRETGTTGPTGPTGVTGGTGGTGVTECKDSCKVGWVARHFTVSGAIEQAICDAQCTVIDWMANLISMVISKVLMPALGV